MALWEFSDTFAAYKEYRHPSPNTLNGSKNELELVIRQWQRQVPKEIPGTLQTHLY